jgi:hypothetical protein
VDLEAFLSSPISVEDDTDAAVVPLAAVAQVPVPEEQRTDVTEPTLGHGSTNLRIIRHLLDRDDRDSSRTRAFQASKGEFLGHICDQLGLSHEGMRKQALFDLICMNVRPKQLNNQCSR